MFVESLHDLVIFLLSSQSVHKTVFTFTSNLVPFLKNNYVYRVSSLGEGYMIYADELLNVLRHFFVRAIWIIWIIISFITMSIRMMVSWALDCLDPSGASMSLSSDQCFIHGVV